MQISADYYGNFALVLLKMKEFSKSFDMSCKAIEINPKNYKYYDQKASALCLMNRFDEALSSYATAYKLSNDNEYLEKIGVATREKKAYENSLLRQLQSPSSSSSSSSSSNNNNIKNDNNDNKSEEKI